MEKTISILGSTGSIGLQTLSVADKLGLRVAAITADKNVKLMEEQIRRQKPSLAVLYDTDAARDLKARVSDTFTRVAGGMEGLIEAASFPDAGTVVTAVAGSDGLRPTLAAIECGKRVALANKETLVCAGGLVMSAAQTYGAEIIPVDSEHSAIFQCLDSHRENMPKRIILTASGGPFYGKTLEQMRNVTPETAVKHPRWSMGQKVSLDSATLMNKGFEFIEAMHLFSLKPEEITVLIHPESIIHSMVEFKDNSVIAQLSQPDMRLPIQYALTYPVRLASDVPALDFAQIASLTFGEPDYDAFPCLRLAQQCAHLGMEACAALSGADDAATELFLAGKIGFGDICPLLERAVGMVRRTNGAGLSDVIDIISRARRFVRESAG